MRRQIRPLERQAAAARSHASLAEELRALRLHLVGRELAGLDARREAATTERGRLAESETDARRLASTELDAAAEATAAELATQREEDLVVALTRVQGLAERCRGLLGVVAERRRSIARALEASADTDVVSTLEADAARLAAELEATTARGRRPGAARRGGARRPSTRSARTSPPTRPSFADLAGQRAAEEAYAMARGRIEPLRSALERERGALSAPTSGWRPSTSGAEALEAEASRARRSSSHDGCAPSIPAPGPASRASRAGPPTRPSAVCATPRSALRGAERQRHRLEARAEALARQVADERAGPDAEVLGEVRRRARGRSATSSTSTTAGWPPSRRPSGRRWAPSWSRAPARRAPCWPRCTSARWSGPCSPPRIRSRG